MTVEPLSLTAERVTRLLGASAHLLPRVTHAFASPDLEVHACKDDDE